MQTCPNCGHPYVEDTCAGLPCCTHCGANPYLLDPTFGQGLLGEEGVTFSFDPGYGFHCLQDD